MAGYASGGGPVQSCPPPVATDDGIPVPDCKHSIGYMGDDIKVKKSN